MSRQWIVFLSVAFVLLGSGPASAILLTVDVPPEPVVIGNSLQIGVSISGLGDFTSSSLGAFDVDLNFDPAVLSFVGAIYGDPVLGNQLDVLGLGSIGATTPGVDSVNLFEVSLDSADDLNALQAGAFTLATLSFSTVALGTSFLALSVNALADANGDPLAADVAGASVAVTEPAAVPMPASLTLVACAVGAALLVYRTSLRAVSCPELRTYDGVV